MNSQQFSGTLSQPTEVGLATILVTVYFQLKSVFHVRVDHNLIIYFGMFFSSSFAAPNTNDGFPTSENAFPFQILNLFRIIVLVGKR